MLLTLFEGFVFKDHIFFSKIGIPSPAPPHEGVEQAVLVPLLGEVLAGVRPARLFALEAETAAMTETSSMFSVSRWVLNSML